MYYASKLQNATTIKTLIKIRTLIRIRAFLQNIFMLECEYAKLLHYNFRCCMSEKNTIK